MASTHLSPPWVTYYKEIEAFFKYDDDVTVIYNDEDYTVKMYVRSAQKAKALEEILASEVEFGNIILKVIVVPPNSASTTKTKIARSIYSVALEGNPAVTAINTVSGIMSNPLTYVVFRKEVVQYWTDDLGDYNGIKSTLYQNIADEIFVNHKEGIFFCTDTEDPVILSTPLGEWP